MAGTPEQIIDTSRRFRLNSPSVISETLDAEAVASDGEAIVVNLSTGIYYTIKGDGIHLWNAIIGGVSAEELVDLVAARTGATRDRCEEAVTNFYAELLEEDLIAMRNGDEAPPTSVGEAALAGAGAGLLEPTLARHPDMQDLILLDPVHEVSTDLGWPHADPSA